MPQQIDVLSVPTPNETAIPNDCGDYLSVSGPRADVERFIAEVVVTGNDRRGEMGPSLTNNSSPAQRNAMITSGASSDGEQS